MKKHIEKKKMQKKGIKRDIIIFVFFFVFTIILLSIFPDKKNVILKISWNFFLEMILILPAVMILMGLFSVFIHRETVVKYLGKAGGIKAVFLGILMGALPTGPLYVAFPIASALMKKGAKISSVIAFLSAWACIKIPQEMVELQFLGAKFMIARLVLTIVFVIIMGILIEKLIEWSDENKKNMGGEKNASI